MVRHLCVFAHGQRGGGGAGACVLQLVRLAEAVGEGWAFRGVGRRCGTEGERRYRADEGGGCCAAMGVGDWMVSCVLCDFGGGGGGVSKGTVAAHGVGKGASEGWMTCLLSWREHAGEQGGVFSWAGPRLDRRSGNMRGFFLFSLPQT